MKTLLYSVSFTALCLATAISIAPKTNTSNSVQATKLATAEVTTQEIIDLAEAFKATLSTSQQSTLQLTYTLAHAETWSNLPAAMSPRLGLKMGNLTSAQLTAARALIAAMSGTGNEGYAEIYGLWMADNYLEDNGGGSTYGEGNFYIAIFGTPSLTGTFEIQMTGHHRTVSNTYVNGELAGATPSFVATEPYAAFTENGISYQPMVEEKTTLVAMLAGLNTTQLSTAHLSGTYADLVCGPQHDWSFPTTKSGLQVGTLSDTQKQLVMDAIATYVNDVDDVNAETILAQYQDELDDTYIAYATDATLNSQNAYVRIDGPGVWIEYSTQNGVILSPKHPHSIWRDHVTDYGGTGYTAATNSFAMATGISQYPNPVKEFTTFSFNLKNGGDTTIAIYDLSGRLVQNIQKDGLSSGVNAVTVNLGALQSGTYIYKISNGGSSSKGFKFIKL